MNDEKKIHNVTDELRSFAAPIIRDAHSHLVVVEDLNVAGMVKNRHLSRSISDASWSMFRQMLSYKAESAGRKLIAVPAHCTSQMCSSCGEYVEKSLSVRTHLCPYCGYQEDRDVNAARNILRRGLDEAIVECSA